VRWQQERESGIRRDAVARSTSTVLGKTTEHLAPYLGEFPYNPRDVRFIGSPVDLVVFDGLDAGLVERVVLVEIKSGAGQLSTRQRQVRDAVNAGQVSWDEWRLPHP
jgi:predicted Holliday junction resolvase-like endonuclease